MTIIQPGRGHDGRPWPWPSSALQPRSTHPWAAALALLQLLLLTASSGEGLQQHILPVCLNLDSDSSCINNQGSLHSLWACSGR